MDVRQTGETSVRKHGRYRCMEGMLTMHNDSLQYMQTIKDLSSTGIPIKGFVVSEWLEEEEVSVSPRVRGDLT